MHIPRLFLSALLTNSLALGQVFNAEEQNASEALRLDLMNQRSKTFGSSPVTTCPDGALLENQPDTEKPFKGSCSCQIKVKGQIKQKKEGDYIRRTFSLTGESGDSHFVDLGKSKEVDDKAFLRNLYRGQDTELQATSSKANDKENFNVLYSLRTENDNALMGAAQGIRLVKPGEGPEGDDFGYTHGVSLEGRWGTETLNTRLFFNNRLFTRFNGIKKPNPNSQYNSLGADFRDVLQLGMERRETPGQNESGRLRTYGIQAEYRTSERKFSPGVDTQDFWHKSTGSVEYLYSEQEGKDQLAGEIWLMLGQREKIFEKGNCVCTADIQGGAVVSTNFLEESALRGEGNIRLGLGERNGYFGKSQYEILLGMEGEIGAERCQMSAFLGLEAQVANHCSVEFGIRHNLSSDFDNQNAGYTDDDIIYTLGVNLIF